MPMRRILVSGVLRIYLLISVLLISIFSFGRGLSQKDFNNLPIELQNQIKANVQTNKELAKTDVEIEKVGKWVGLGREVGLAVNESLGAVTQTAEEFSQTGLGKLTIGLVIWKIVGTDILQLLLGFVWFCSIVYLSMFIYRKYGKPQRVLVSETYNSESKKYDRTWKVVNEHTATNMDNYRIVSILIFIIGLGLTLAIVLP